MPLPTDPKPSRIRKRTKAARLATPMPKGRADLIVKVLKRITGGTPTAIPSGSGFEVWGVDAGWVESTLVDAKLIPKRAGPNLGK